MPFDAMYFDGEDSYILNDQPIMRGADRDLIAQYAEKLLMGPLCPFCGSQLRIARFGEREENSGHELEWEEAMTVGECPGCAFGHCEWHRDLGLDGYGCPISEWESQLSKLGEYPDDLPHACKSELAQHLRLHGDLWSSLNPKRMEVLVADVFRANHYASEVFHVGRPDDGGVDVIFINSGGTKWLMQVKSHRNSAASEGVGVIRNLLGAMTLDGTPTGVLVTNADHFTYRAYEAVGRAREKGYTVNLIDRGKLNRMLDPLLPYGEWRRFVRRRRPNWMRHFNERLSYREQLTLNSYLLGLGRTLSQ
jgi:hypothetical protein